jgi:hypothetical protein
MSHAHLPGTPLLPLRPDWVRAEAVIPALRLGVGVR